MEKSRVKLIEPLEEFTTVMFVNHGIIQIGYEINGENRYVIQRNNGIVIGAYGITNNERSKHIYRCKTEVEGYFIRKEQWLDALIQN